MVIRLIIYWIRINGSIYFVYFVYEIFVIVKLVINVLVVGKIMFLMLFVKEKDNIVVCFVILSKFVSGVMIGIVSIVWFVSDVKIRWISVWKL